MELPMLELWVCKVPEGHQKPLTCGLWSSVVTTPSCLDNCLLFQTESHQGVNRCDFCVCSCKDFVFSVQSRVPFFEFKIFKTVSRVNS